MKNGGAQLTEEYRTTFEFDRLIDQILRGEKTASACTIEDASFAQEYDSPLVIGQTYVVYDSQRLPRCKILLTDLEVCRWDAIPQRLWEGETEASADEFRRDHQEYFNHPEDLFEFMAFYFQLVRT